MKLLITGGAGYIGSHTVRYAQNLGHEVVVIDNFSTGHQWALNDCEVLDVDLVDRDNLDKKLKRRQFDGVIHFAAKSLVSESCNKPNMYFNNNIAGTINLLDLMLMNDIKNIVFSSSAAIFGSPQTNKIDENHPKNPINPYGQSKLMVEKILEEICKAHDLNACCLRYFNAAGADSSEEIGEAHDPETHLIPNVLKSLLSDDELLIHGNDYNTRDGTCIRDYIHVNDLAKAHLLAMKYNNESKGFSAFNLGNGEGFSVLDIIKYSSSITGKKLNYKFAPRRIGDPPTLVANNMLAKKKLKWEPNNSSLHEIILSAWKWHLKYN